MDYREMNKPKPIKEVKPDNFDWIKNITKKFNQFFGEMDLDFLNCLACNKSETEASNNPLGEQYHPIEVQNKKACHHDLAEGFQFSRIVSDDNINFKSIDVDLIKCWANKFNPCVCRKKEAAQIRCSQCDLVKPQITSFENKNYCSILCIKKSLNTNNFSKKKI